MVRMVELIYMTRYLNTKIIFFYYLSYICHIYGEEIVCRSKTLVYFTSTGISWSLPFRLFSLSLFVATSSTNLSDNTSHYAPTMNALTGTI